MWGEQFPTFRKFIVPLSSGTQHLIPEDLNLWQLHCEHNIMTRSNVTVIRVVSRHEQQYKMAAISGVCVCVCVLTLADSSTT
jgi:hypothetical protein